MKPSDGLEPSTPSLPWVARRHRRTSLIGDARGGPVPSVVEAVDLLLTQTGAAEVEFGVARIHPRFLRPPYRGDLGILRTVSAFATFRILWIVCGCESRFRSNLMGRAGIEPATLGLKVPCSTD